MNYESLNARKLRFFNIVDSLNPDIIIGTEFWLTNKNLNSRGVFIAARNDLSMTKDDDLEANYCEVMWCRFSLPGSKSLQVGAYYRPGDGDNESLQELSKSLEMFSSKDN